MSLLKKREKTPPSVRELLITHVGGFERERAPTDLHASDLTKQTPLFCPREFKLRQLVGSRTREEFIDHARRMTFDDGHDKQARITTYLHAFAVGRWKCLRCEEVSDWGPHPEYDEWCTMSGKAHIWRYTEPVFRHPKYKDLSGSIDILVQFPGDGPLRAVEVKIIKADEWEKLEAPLAEHRVRTQLYLQLIAESDAEHAADVDTSYGHILYVMRGFGKMDKTRRDRLITPLKEYVVERDDASVAKYFQMAAEIQRGIPRQTCGSMLDKRAESCLYRRECFSGKFPPTIKGQK